MLSENTSATQAHLGIILFSVTCWFCSWASLVTCDGKQLKGHFEALGRTWRWEITGDCLKVKPPNPRPLYSGQIIFGSEILEVETSIKQNLTYGILSIKTQYFDSQRLK